MLATFSTFVFSDRENILTPEKVFKSMSLFAIMSMPMALLPMLIVYAVEVINRDQQKLYRNGLFIFMLDIDNLDMKTNIG